MPSISWNVVFHFPNLPLNFLQTSAVFLRTRLFFLESNRTYLLVLNFVMKSTVFNVSVFLLSVWTFVDFSYRGQYLETCIHKLSFYTSTQIELLAFGIFLDITLHTLLHVCCFSAGILIILNWTFFQSIVHLFSNLLLPFFYGYVPIYCDIYMM